ncbi:glycoside hydrolase domain-containing protein [Paenibacillus rhizoplanae]
MLRASEDNNDAYYIRLEPIHNRLVFDMWPRRIEGEMQWHIKGDHPHAVELEVPVELHADTNYNIEIVVENSVCVVYLADQVAMTTRLYNLKKPATGAVLFRKAGRTLNRHPFQFPTNRRSYK